MIEKRFNLEDKVSIVTGAAGFLGQYEVEALASEGSNIVITDLYEDKCKNLAERISKEYKVKCIASVMDIRCNESVKKVSESVLKKFGRIDILVNNAAINDPVSEKRVEFEEYSIENWNKIIDINLTGQFITSQVIGSIMAKKGNGSIINISSIYGFLAPDQRIYKTKNNEFIKSPSYGVSKAGLLNLTTYLAAYWGEKVRVNAVSFGGIPKELKEQDKEFVSNYCKKVPMGRMCRKEDIGGPIIFLASNMSSYITGANIIVDGGLSIW